MTNLHDVMHVSHNAYKLKTFTAFRIVLVDWIIDKEKRKGQKLKTDVHQEKLNIKNIT